MGIDLKYATLRRFWKKVRVNPDTGCWEWIGSFTSDKGNGSRLPKMSIDGQQIGARRLSYLIHLGTLPANIGCICHNRACVNPQHLTPALANRALVGKKYVSRPTRKWRSNDEKIARRVLTLRKAGKTQPEIARRVGIGQSEVSVILRMVRLCRQRKLKPLPQKARSKNA